MAFILATPSGPIQAPNTSDEASQAQIASTGTPAIFTHEDNKLVLQDDNARSGKDRIVLGRRAVEDRSLLPKRVLFLPEEESLGDVRLEMDNGRGRVFFSNAPVQVVNGELFAVLMDHDEATDFEIVST